MQFNVEWFSPSIGTPIISLAEYGIVFNKAAITVLNNAHSIRIGFDRDQKLIIVQGLKEEQSSDDTIAFAERERNGFIRINNKDFVRFILRYCPEIKLDRAKRFLGRVEGEFLVVDLNTPADGSDEENLVDE
ncbi:hypothetical protein ABHN11_28000 [Brevibacillus centrosporus]|uniref:hypothetical protein n=1 Tax=Brevibacillus centrosporus TaxID=54910 RepID=UPI003D19B8BA